MTISPKMSLKSVISREDVQLTPAQLGYMGARAKGEAHASVLKLFMGLSKDEGLTRAFLARRLGKKPEQITRWLGAPGNWTLDTLSNLLAAMGYEPVFSVRPLNSHKQDNEHHPLAGSTHAPNAPSAQVGTVYYKTEIGADETSRHHQGIKYRNQSLQQLEMRDARKPEGV